VSVGDDAVAVHYGRIAKGACRCKACVDLAREVKVTGSRSIGWATVNETVHHEVMMQKAKEEAEYRSKIEAEVYQRTKVKSVEAARLRANLHRKLEDPVAKANPPKKRYKHIYGMQVPFSFTFDQAVGFAAGLSFSLPVVSVLSLTPDVAVWVVTGLTALGTATPSIIRNSRDTEKQKTARALSPKATRKTRLASANADREAVILAWAKYETEVALQIDFPAMTDVRKPETAALAKSLRAAEIASRHAGESLEALIRYEDAVLDLENAFKAAERAAKTDQEHPLTEDQRELAHTLLTMAVDPAGNVHERRQAHQRLLKLLDGVIVLAEPARLALEQAAARGQLDR